MTAKQFIQKGISDYPIPIDDLQFKGTRVEELLIGFAKLKVEAALKAASEDATASMRRTRPFQDNPKPIVDKESILSAYPLKNIK